MNAMNAINARHAMHTALIVICLGVSATATSAQSQRPSPSPSQPPSQPPAPPQSQPQSQSHSHSDAAGHHHDASSSVAEQFLADARAGTARYHDRRAAIADGYRKLGPAFPGMGEHWVHPGLIVNGKLDARTPSVLGYADIDGVPTLIGLAYAVPVLPGGTPPATPMGSAIWHEHSDAVDDETLLLVHGDAAAGDTTRPRLAMFHAWTALDNPDGPFAQNNWALPFAQLGLTPPPAVSAAAAQAASLLTVGEVYWLKLLDALVHPTAVERRALETAVVRARERVESWRESLERSTVMPEGAALLERIWVDLWDDLENAVTGDARARLKTYGGHPATMHAAPHVH